MRSRRWVAWAARYWPLLLLVVGAIWACSAMFHVKWWQSHENIWYPVRVREYQENWSAGTWYARWCPDFYGGYGYPFLNFYAPLVYVSGALVSTIGSISPMFALKIVMVVCSIASACGVFGLMHGETKRVDAAFLGAALWVFLPYRSTDLFERGDLAEYTAYCWLPFVLWGYRAIGRASASRRVVVALATAIVHALVLLTHAIVGLFTTQFVGIYFLAVMWRERRRPRTWPLLLVTIGASVSLAAIYLGPAFLEKHLVFFERLNHGRFKPWLNMLSLSQITHHFYTPGWPWLVGLGGWLGTVLASRWSVRARLAARTSAPWWLISIGLFTLLFSWSTFLWHLIPFWAQTQFPWRLNGFIGLFGAVAVAIWWAGLVPEWRGRSLLLAIVLVAIMPALLHDQRRVALEPHIPLTPEHIRNNGGTSTGGDEYLPRTVTTPPPPRDWSVRTDPLGGAARLEKIDGLHWQVSVDAPGPMQTSIAVFAFPGWKLTGTPGARLLTSPDGFLQVETPAAGHYDVVLSFGHTGVQLLSSLVSLLALLGVVPALVACSRRFLPPE